MAIELTCRDMCTGCAACYNACKSNAIEMKEDFAGFLYPEIDDEICINCGRCTKVCPINKKEYECKDIIECYLGQSNDSRRIYKCASGGVFYEIAHEVIDRGGIVVGAAYDNKFTVEHIICNSMESLDGILGSKYVQSKVGDVYGKVEEYLKNDIQVCFSGTPCQVAGLKCYLDKDYNNLLTVDFLCHSVPSPRVWKLYLEYRNRKLGAIKSIRFKDKKYGYTLPVTRIQSAAKDVNYTSQNDCYMRLFLSGKISRKACDSCQFRMNHYSDITLADSYKYIDENSAFKKKLGVNRVFVHTLKGKKTIETINRKTQFQKIDKKKAVNKWDTMNHDTTKEPLQLLELQSDEVFVKKYFRENVFFTIQDVLKKSIYRIGLYDYIKSIIIKLIKEKRCK